MSFLAACGPYVFVPTTREYVFMYLCLKTPCAYVPMNRFGIKKCLPQVAQEVKPEAPSFDNLWSSLRSGVPRG